MVSDAELLSRFRDGTLEPADFDHRAHVRAAWLYLTQLSTEVAIERFTADIERYARQHGAAEKFHRTLTEALLRLLASHLPRERTLGWQELIARHPIILDDARGLLGRFYSPARLHCAEARTRYLAPDLAPMPVD